MISCLDVTQRSKVAFLNDDFSTLFLPVRDGVLEDIAATFPALFDFMAEALSQRRSRVLLHCEVGISRSATLATAWLMKSEGLGFLEAFRELRARRPRVLPNIGFATQLQRLEHTLHPNLRSPGEPSSLARYLHEVCNVPTELDVLQSVLDEREHEALAAIEAIFGEIPRVVQGARL